MPNGEAKGKKSNEVSGRKVNCPVIYSYCTNAYLIPCKICLHTEMTVLEKKKHDENQTNQIKSK